MKNLPTKVGSNAVRPTTADIEAVLVAMFATAQAADESFVDVTAAALCKAVTGDSKSSQGMAACCGLMKRMMIPGDNELTDPRASNGPRLLIRFRVPR